jgi:hypothetical protein
LRAPIARPTCAGVDVGNRPRLLDGHGESHNGGRTGRAD